jgi:GxxExxY protein
MSSIEITNPVSQKKITKCTICRVEGHNRKNHDKHQLSIDNDSELCQEISSTKESKEEKPHKNKKESIKVDGFIREIKNIAADVHEKLGAGHTESVYHNAMKIGLHDARISFETERDIIINYMGRYAGTVRADLIIENTIVVELKSSSGSDAIVDDAEEQCRIYMKETGIDRGIVIVFPKRVKFNLITRDVIKENDE